MILALLLAYLIGSIPFGLLITRWAGLGDIRSFGSGNIGATNVLRKGGKKLGALTLALDIGKGVAAVLAAYALTDGIITAYFTAYYAMLAALIGHCFPVWLKFKGGKGVATAIGVIVAYHHIIASTPFYLVILPLACVWIGTLLLTRYVSLASIVAAISLPFITMYGSQTGAVEILIALLVLFKHRDNIRRLRRGEEHRFSFSRKKEPSA